MLYIYITITAQLSREYDKTRIYELILKAKKSDFSFSLLQICQCTLFNCPSTYGRKQTFYDGQPGSPSGILHLPMEPAYSEALRQLVINTADEMGLHVHKEGTVVVIEGPRFSSKSESKMYMAWGGDLVNMTAVPELILAKEAGLLYATIALSTDYDCWRDCGEKVSHAYVLDTFQKNALKVVNLMRESVKKIGLQNWDTEIDELQTTVKKSIM